MTKYKFEEPDIQSLVRRLSALEFMSDKDIRIEMYEIKKDFDNFFKQWEEENDIASR